jgi:hypothetical protein
MAIESIIPIPINQVCNATPPAPDRLIPTPPTLSFPFLQTVTAPEAGLSLLANQQIKAATQA